jgi:uncharacterized damage-inducible protein DinB
MVTSVLLRFLDEAFERKAWHGPNLRGSLRGVSHSEADWRPANGRHNIRELVLHTAYWKYAVRNRLAGGRRGSFVVKGSNWFDVQGPLDKKTWKELIDLLVREHRNLRAVAAALPEDRLEQRVQGSSQTALTLLLGIAAHDLYHAGQIQLLKRLHQAGRRKR